jgi:hypothetical protein
MSDSSKLGRSPKSTPWSRVLVTQLCAIADTELNKIGWREAELWRIGG